MPLVFISYNRKDGKYAKSLRDQIMARGIEVFLDIDSIAPSVSFPMATAESILECDLFILLWSHNAEASHFVHEELNIALAKKKVIFPVLLDDCIRPAALSAINSMKGVTPTKVANRVVGVLLREDKEEEKTTKPTIRNYVWVAVPILLIVAAATLSLIGPFALWKAKDFPSPKSPKRYEIVVVCDSFCNDTVDFKQDTLHPGLAVVNHGEAIVTPNAGVMNTGPNISPRPQMGQVPSTMNATQAISGQVITEATGGHPGPISNAVVTLIFNSNCTPAGKKTISLTTNSLGQFSGKLCVEESEEIKVTTQVPDFTYRKKTSFFKATEMQNVTIVLNK